MSLVDYARDVTAEVIAVGRCGSLVDWEGEYENRAYVSRYPAESILNWRVERLNGRCVLTLVVLYEPDAGPELQGSDEFRKIVGGQIRVLRLVPAERAGVAGSGSHACCVEIWHRDAAAETVAGEWRLVRTQVLMRHGLALPRIPFVFHGPRNSLPDVDKVPLSAVIDANMDHFRLDADFKHGMHFTALPTAWVSGFDRESTLRIGSSTAWTSDNVGATAGFLEYKGQGLRTFERSQDRDERSMAVLGARLLESSKKVGETAEAIELRQAGENSILGNLALSVSASLTHVLSWVYWWHSTEVNPDDAAHNQVSVELNSDYSLKGMSGEEITALVSAWQAGAISRSTMLDLFRRGELLPDNLTNEEESKLLDAESEKRRSEMKDLSDAGSFSNTPETSRRNRVQG
jgi:hypothetical protein